jgi:hypothetical protein
VSAAKRRKRIRKESSPSKLEEEGQPYVAGLCPVMGAVRWWYEIEPL